MKPWSVNINLEGKKKHIGSYGTEVEAAQAYDDAVRKWIGPRGITNFDTMGNRNVSGSSSSSSSGSSSSSSSSSSYGTEVEAAQAYDDAVRKWDWSPRNYQFRRFGK